MLRWAQGVRGCVLRGRLPAGEAMGCGLDPEEDRADESVHRHSMDKGWEARRQAGVETARGSVRPERRVSLSSGM